MAHPLKTPEKMTVVAELQVTGSDGKVETVRSFEKGWTRMRELAQVGTPVKCVLTGFVRKTDEEMRNP